MAQIMQPSMQHLAILRPQCGVTFGTSAEAPSLLVKLCAEPSQANLGQLSSVWTDLSRVWLVHKVVGVARPQGEANQTKSGIRIRVFVVTIHIFTCKERSYTTVPFPGLRKHSLLGHNSYGKRRTRQGTRLRPFAVGRLWPGLENMTKT